MKDVCVCVCVCRDDSRRYSVYSSSARSIKPKVLIRLLGLHLGGGDVDIELTQGWENMRDSRSLEAPANNMQL